MLMVKNIYRVQEPIGTSPARMSDLVITEPKHISGVPTHPLRKRPGHIARIYKETYWVRERVSGTFNGVKQDNTRIYGAVGSLKDANRMVEEAITSGKHTKDSLIITRDSSLTSSERSAIQLQDDISLGRMFWNKRADHRVQGLDGSAEVADPLQSLVENIESTATFATKQDIIDNMKKRFMNTFSGKNGLVSSGKGFPRDVAEIEERMTSVNKSQLAPAKAMFRYIRSAEGVMGMDSRKWRDSWMTIAEGITGDSGKVSLLNNLRHVSAAPARFLANHSINAGVKSLAFLNMIVMNPARQVVVQSQQFMALSAIDPVGALAAFPTKT